MDSPFDDRIHLFLPTQMTDEQELFGLLQTLDTKVDELKVDFQSTRNDLQADQTLFASRQRALLLDLFDRTLAPGVDADLTWGQACFFLNGLIDPSLADRLSADTLIATLLGTDLVNVEGALNDNKLTSDPTSDALLAKVFHLVNAHRELSLIAKSIPPPLAIPVNTPVEMPPNIPEGASVCFFSDPTEPVAPLKRKAEEPVDKEVEPKKRKGRKALAKQ